MYYYKENYTAIYNTLTGKFIILNNYISEQTFRELCLKNHLSANLLTQLLKKGIVLDANETKDNEILRYKKNYVLINNTLYYHKEDKCILLKIPGFGGTVRLDEHASKIWLSYFSSTPIVADSVNDIMYLIHNYPEVPLFQLGESSAPSDMQFANRYLFDFKSEGNISSNSFIYNSIYLKLTDFCNLNCKMCGQAKNRMLSQNHKNIHFLDIDDVKKFVNGKKRDIKYIFLWGGEPFLHPAWELFSTNFASQYTSIATNGTLILQNLKKIFDTHIDELVISLDGLERTHDHIRGCTGAFSQIIRGISAVQSQKKNAQEKPKIIINCTITDDNLYDLYQLVSLSQQLGVNEVVFQLPMWLSQEKGSKFTSICKNKWGILAKSWMGFKQNFSIDVDYLHDFFLYCKYKHPYFVTFLNREIQDRASLYKYFYTEDDISTMHFCNIMHRAISIEADGTLVTCPDFPDISLGKIDTVMIKDYPMIQQKKDFEYLFYKLNGFSICKRCCHYI